MRSLSKLLTFFFILFFLTGAYRPVEISALADLKEKTIEVSVKTQTNTPHENYIRRIELHPDKGPVIVKNIFFQKRGYYQNVTFHGVDLKKVKNIIIKAYVHKGGALEKKFKIKDILKEKKD